MTAQPSLPFARKLRRPKPALEVRTHIAVVDLLRWAAKPEWLFYHPANGNYRTDETGALLKRLGVLPGVPDLILIGPDGVHHYLELKRGNAALSMAQVRFRTEMRTRGVPYAVARSFDEAVAVLNGWNVLRPLKVQ